MPLLFRKKIEILFGEMNLNHRLIQPSGQKKVKFIVQTPPNVWHADTDTRAREKKKEKKKTNTI